MPSRDRMYSKRFRPASSEPSMEFRRDREFPQAASACSRTLEPLPDERSWQRSCNPDDMHADLGIKKILVPIDFSETSQRVLDLGRTLADVSGASLHLLHVIGYPLATARTIDQERREACSRLDALLDSTDRDKRNATTSCEVGTPAHEIVQYATKHATDLIVMGTHWHGLMVPMAGGSIAEAVVGLAPCAVLAVKSADTGACKSAIDPATLANISPDAGISPSGDGFPPSKLI